MRMRIAMVSAGQPAAPEMRDDGAGHAYRARHRAVSAARAGGLASWCLTGPAPNPLAEVCDEAVCVYPAGARALALTATVPEAHQVALHLIRLSFEVAERDPAHGPGNDRSHGPGFETRRSG